MPVFWAEIWASNRATIPLPVESYRGVVYTRVAWHGAWIIVLAIILSPQDRDRFLFLLFFMNSTCLLFFELLFPDCRTNQTTTPFPPPHRSCKASTPKHPKGTETRNLSSQGTLSLRCQWPHVGVDRCKMLSICQITRHIRQAPWALFFLKQVAFSGGGGGKRHP